MFLINLVVNVSYLHEVRFRSVACERYQLFAGSYLIFVVPQGPLITGKLVCRVPLDFIDYRICVAEVLGLEFLLV